MRRTKATPRSSTRVPGSSGYFLLLAGLGLVGGMVLSSPDVRAEGSAQLGQIDPNADGGLMRATVLHVDVTSAEDTLNIAARDGKEITGQGISDPADTNGSNVAVRVSRLAADGSIESSSNYTLTAGAGLLTQPAAPVQLPYAEGPNTVAPLSIGVTAGRYEVQFLENVEPFDITVTSGVPTLGSPLSTGVTASGGRLSSKDWRFVSDTPGGTDTPMDSDFFVRASVGDDYEYIWKLDFQGLLGGYMCLTTNDLGLPGEFARSSQTYATVQAAYPLNGGGNYDRFTLCPSLSQYDIYVNPPADAKPRPPTPQLNFFRIGACGALIEGSGGVFEFDTSLDGTFEIVIDANADTIFDPDDGDVVIPGRATQGLNEVPWDGKDGNGVSLPQGEYESRLYLRVGEFHFTGSDVEAVTGGVGVYAVDPSDFSETPARIYWDDRALNATGTPASPIRSTPNGVLTTDPGVAASAGNGRHSWTGTLATSPGNDAYVDTWVYGNQVISDALTIEVLDPDADEDNDGLINGRECEIGSLAYDEDTDGDGVLDGIEEPSNVIGTDPQDTDGDGIPDPLDVDDDDDGILTVDEPTDANNNNIPDRLEPPQTGDADGDGVPDVIECPGAVNCADSDGDGTADYLDTDDDNDGVPTLEEDLDGDGDPSNDDTDGDDKPNYLDNDDDNDGVLTIDEDVDGDGDPTNDDTDGDGTPNYLDTDDDGDGILTKDELTDADNSGTPDYLESAGDADNDGIPDVVECPVVSDCPDSDNDGIADFEDADDDNDGVPTAQEDIDGDGDPTNDDTDGDSIPDYLDTDDDGDGLLTIDEDVDGDGDPTNDDTDGDSIPNYLDTDDDDDGVPTATEVVDADTYGDDVDGDDLPNWLDPDADGDGVGDGTEAAGDGDSNKDGVPDYLDPNVSPGDTDGDGVPDAVECPGATNCADTDMDGIADFEDPDDDNDGILTQFEAPNGNLIDTDGDSVPDYLDPDDDGDGVLTAEEGADANGDGNPDDAQDTDGDDKPDYLDADDDGDSIPTADEDPDPNGDGNPDDARDTDGDDKPDYLDADDDGDGIPTIDEPTDANNDGTPDYLEPSTGADSDGDGVPDAIECPSGNNCADSDGDGTPDYLDTDDDNDGVPTADELGDGATPQDTDGDGKPDYLDIDDDGDAVPTADELGDGATPQDTDGDGTPDYLDIDDDGDGVPTIDELGDPNDPQDTDGDGKPDYLDTDDDGDGKPTADELGDVNNPRDTDGDGIPDYLDPRNDTKLAPSRVPGVLKAGAIEGGGFGCTVTTGAGAGASSGWSLAALLFGMALWTRRRRRAAGVLAAAAVTSAVALPQDAHAQELEPGFALNRYNPAERGSDWFAGESLDFRGHGRVAAGLVLDWAYKPLIAYNANGDEVAPIVENQFYGHLGIAVNLWERLRLAASFPVLFYQNGTPIEFGGASYATRNGAEVGDLRLGADVRLFGEYGDAATLAIGAQLHLPTGDRGAYTGDAELRFVPRAMLAGDVDMLAYSVQAGLDVRGQRNDFAGEPFGTDMTFGGTIGLRLADRKVLLGPELWGATVISDHGDGFFAKRTTPFEGILGGTYFAGDWRFGLGVGPGFTRGLGSPALRVLGKLEWFPQVEAPPPPAPPKDTDGDGILDPDDACPTTPGIASDDPTKHGCPLERKDTDGDGIYDDEDACLNDPGVASEDQAKNGCPPDTDGDGIVDRDDACINEPGEANEDKAKNGCPPPKDSDGDGIIDEDDACPTKAGPASDDPKKNGCPRAEVSGERVVILDRIEFDTGKATIRSESEPILEAVRAVLDENPQIKKMRVEGHTDNRGQRAMNVGLSRRRAAAVVKWLVDNGIDAKRLTSQGFGPDKPVADNETEDGRQDNRRVEFHILETAKASD